MVLLLGLSVRHRKFVRVYVLGFSDVLSVVNMSDIQLVISWFFQFQIVWDDLLLAVGPVLWLEPAIVSLFPYSMLYCLFQQGLPWLVPELAVYRVNAFVVVVIVVDISVKGNTALTSFFTAEYH